MLSESNLPDHTTEAYQIARDVSILKVNIRVTLRIRLYGYSEIRRELGRKERIETERERGCTYHRYRVLIRITTVCSGVCTLMIISESLGAGSFQREPFHGHSATWKGPLCGPIGHTVLVPTNPRHSIVPQEPCVTSTTYISPHEARCRRSTLKLRLR